MNISFQKSHCASNNLPIWTQKVPKEAYRCELPTFTQVFSKMFCSTWTVACTCQKFVQYILLEWGRFMFLRGSVRQFPSPFVQTTDRSYVFSVFWYLCSLFMDLWFINMQPQFWNANGQTRIKSFHLYIHPFDIFDRKYYLFHSYWNREMDCE